MKRLTPEENETLVKLLTPAAAVLNAIESRSR